MSAMHPLDDRVRDESNPYESPATESATPSTPTRRRSKRQLSAPRLVLLSALAVIATFVLLQIWTWTAQFPWSSDGWLIGIPAAIVISGMLALVALAMIKLWRPR